MEEPEIFDAIRRDGIDADAPEVRAAVRAVREHVAGVRARADIETTRLCMRAMAMALSYELQHPEVGDMSGFEAEFDADE